MNHVNDIPAHPYLATIAARFHAGYDRRGRDDCWPWLGQKSSGKRNRGDYGSFSICTGDGERPRWSTHRMAWVLANGLIPDKLQVLHKCDNPPCCNPRHLFLGTNQDNNADKVAKGRLAVGERAGVAKLTADQVLAIRADPRADAKIALAYGLSRFNVSWIKRGLGWAHISTETVVRIPEAYGVGHYRARLFPDAVRDIRTGRLSPEGFANLYDVNKRTVLDVVDGVSWKHVI